MRRGSILFFAGVAGATFFATTIAATAEPSFVGTWRSETTMAGAGGYGMVVDIENVFSPDGKYSSLTNGRYTTGPAAGQQIGAVRDTGRYLIKGGQGIIEFDNETHESTTPTTRIEKEFDRYQFTSATSFTLQSLTGGPVVVFQKVQ